MHCSGRPPQSPRGGRPEAVAQISNFRTNSWARNMPCTAIFGANSWCGFSIGDQRSWTVSGAIGAGSRVSPIRNSSTAAAHDRPSAMAQTMRL
jgi:hypothetical protein